MSTEKTAWGFQSDNDKSLTTAQGGKFGLNKATISKFEYNANAGKDESAADAIDLTVKIGDKEYRSRIYDITGPLFKGESSISPGEPGYIELYEAEKKQKEAVVLHIVKAFGVTEDQIKMALQTGNVVDFPSWAKAMCSLKGEGFETKAVDVFLEYQWALKGDNTRTFLQIPQNMKGGRFLTQHVAPNGSWEAVNGEDGLRYVDGAQNEHPFTKSKNFMESPKANQIGGDQPVNNYTTTSGPADQAAMTGTTAAKSNWG